MRSLMQWILIHIFNSHVSLTKAFGTYIFIEDGWDFVPQEDAMETQRKCGITASDIDAMTGEELLELAKAQGTVCGPEAANAGGGRGLFPGAGRSPLFAPVLLGAP